MADLIQALDPSQLILLQTTLSFFTAPFVSPTYNLPLFLFGIYAQDKLDSNEPLRVFSGLVGFSAIFDIIWLAKTENQHWFVKLLTIINLIVKVPTFLSLLAALRGRGDRFGAGGLSGNSRFGGSETVWSMPPNVEHFPTASRGAYSQVGGDNGLPGADLERGKPLPSAPTPAPPAPSISITSPMPHPAPPAAAQVHQFPATAPPPPPGAFQI